MIVSGSNFHSLAEQREVSFILRGNIDDLTGEATFGFSGENKSISFNFTSGKIYDPDGRFFDTYNEIDASNYVVEEDHSIFISGNISKTSYDYYNKYGNASCSIGTKDNFKINRFFFDTTGCQFNADLQVFGSPIEYEIIADDYFLANGNWTAKIKNKDEDRSFRIFDITGESSKGMFDNVGDYSGVEVINEKSLILKQKANSIGDQEIVLTMDTDMGEIRKGFTALSTTQFSSFDYSIDENDLNTAWSGLNIGETGKQGSFTYNSSLIGGSGASSVVESDRDITIWLLHYSGATGESGSFARVTGADVTYSGSDYHQTPEIIVSGGDPVTGINGKTLPAKLSGMINNGYLTGFKVIQSGIYNTQGGLPSLIISGGGNLAVTGSGEATTGYHPKEFTGYWNVSYSSGSNVFESFRDSGYYHSTVGGYYKAFTISKDLPSVNIRVSFDNADEDKMISKLRIDGYNSNQDEYLLTGMISGSELFLT
jgi:hypothetical protein